MRDEMIQEAVLDSIDAIEGTQLFAEYNVLMSLSAAYAKSIMIQEASGNLDFDGYEVIQEADGTETKAPGKLSKLKGKLMSTKLVTWIIQAIDWIKRQLAKLSRKKTATPAEQKNLAANVGKLTIDGNQYEAKNTENWGNGTIDSGFTPSVDNAKAIGTSVVDFYKMDIAGFRIVADIKLIEDAVDIFVKAAADFANNETFNEDRIGPAKMPKSVVSDCQKARKLCREAVSVASSKEYPEDNYGRMYNTMGELASKLGKAQESLKKYRDKLSKYHLDGNTRKDVGATAYTKAHSDEFLGNMDKDKAAKLQEDIGREEGLNALAAAAASITAIIDADKTCLQNMLTAQPAKFKSYIASATEELKKRIDAKSASLPKLEAL